MTIADHIREETEELTTFQHIKGLIEKGLDADLIADAFKIPIKRVQTIIQKIKESNQ